MEFSQSASSRIIQLGDRPSVDDKPTQTRGLLFDEFAHLFCKEGHICVEQTCSKPEHQHSWFCQLAWNGVFNSPMIRVVADDHARMRPIAVTDVHQQRENHGEQNTLLDTEENDRSRSD